MTHSKKLQKILICGVLPPPYFGHSMLYEMLMKSSFTTSFDIKFLNMHFWSYESNKKVTLVKIWKLLKYYLHFILILITFRPKFILFNISFYRMPFLKDFLFCATGIVLGVKVILHDHGQYVCELDQSLSGIKRKMLRWMLKHSSGSIVMGENVRPVYKGLMDDQKITVVPGVVGDTYQLDIKPNRPNEDFLNVLYFSYLSQDKGVFVAFEIASIVLRSRRDVMFTFGGPIENDRVASSLEQLQKDYPGRVRYLGYVQDVNERAAIFRGADVFIFSTLRDVFGLVLLHAMAEGVPIVASKEGTIPEIVIEGQTGYLCEKGKATDFADKIIKLLTDTSLRKAMSLSARKRFEEHYSLEKYGQRMTQVVESYN